MQVEAGDAGLQEVGEGEAEGEDLMKSPFHGKTSILRRDSRSLTKIRRKL